MRCVMMLVYMLSTLCNDSAMHSYRRSRHWNAIISFRSSTINCQIMKRVAHKVAIFKDVLFVVGCGECICAFRSWFRRQRGVTGLFGNTLDITRRCCLWFQSESANGLCARKEYACLSSLCVHVCALWRLPLGNAVSANKYIYIDIAHRICVRSYIASIWRSLRRQLAVHAHFQFLFFLGQRHRRMVVQTLCHQLQSQRILRAGRLLDLGAFVLEPDFNLCFV